MLYINRPGRLFPVKVIKVCVPKHPSLNLFITAIYYIIFFLKEDTVKPYCSINIQHTISHSFTYIWGLSTGTRSYEVYVTDSTAGMCGHNISYHLHSFLYNLVTGSTVKNWWIQNGHIIFTLCQKKSRSSFVAFFSSWQINKCRYKPLSS